MEYLKAPKVNPILGYAMYSKKDIERMNNNFQRPFDVKASRDSINGSTYGKPDSNPANRRTFKYGNDE